MSDLDWLSDEAWAVLEPHLPRNRPGAPRVDDRRVISGILHVLRSGCRWKDCPPEYGPPTTIYNRYNRWSAQGLFCNRPLPVKPLRSGKALSSTRSRLGLPRFGGHR